MHDSRVLGGGQHDRRLVGVARERLLAQDVLPGGDRRQRQLGVGMGRGRDRDRVDAGEIERVAERGQGEGDVEHARSLGGLGRVASDDRPHVEAGGAQRPHMGEAAEPRPRDHGAHHAATLPRGPCCPP